MNNDLLRVVCLCAAWCGVCRDYAAPFRQGALAGELRPLADAPAVGALVQRLHT